MGNVLSITSGGRANAAKGVPSESKTMNNASVSSDNDTLTTSEEFHDADNGSEQESRAKAKEEAMTEFKRELSIKREQRKAILARHRTEKADLEKCLASEKKTNYDLSETNKNLRELLIKHSIEIPEEFNKEDVDVSNAIDDMRQEVEKLKTNNIKLRRDLAESNCALQGACSDIADLNAQNIESMKHINALKEVISVSKTMIGLREEQLNELKAKLSEIEKSLADREASMLSNDLREEYERQLQNIRTLRGLYEERARLAEVTRQGILRELEEQKAINQIEVNKSAELTARIDNLETEIFNLKEIIETKNDQIRASKEETRGINAEMSAVNKLFSQVLLGYKNKQDLDQLVHRLEENHGLLTQMAEQDDGSEASSALPKLLLELVSQVEENIEKDANVSAINNKIDTDESNTNHDKFPNEGPKNTTAEEIVENLPKVWRVLMELLSHQNVTETGAIEKVTTCYKSVETKSGPVLVPSVSQTYIRLKDLIIEKLALIKEVNRMKQLNTHLESRLGEQERRLCLVTTELSKTWHVVGRLRRHHHQLHTHEKILKYELQQKRKLLNELKEELEYCREKWEQAREKNTQSEKDWKELRAEFSSRKNKPILLSCNNSAESGYSDERQSDDSSDSNDDSEYINEQLVRCKKKMKKSFETIHDSSTDINVAEREDPVSDLIDVADLPLDTQEADENQESSISEYCNSENISRNEKLNVETEDEIDNIGNESCTEKCSAVENDCPPLQSTKLTSASITPANIINVPVIDAAAILESIKKQNERLAQKDKKLECLEKSGAALIEQRKNTAKLGEKLTETLDHILNGPTTSRNDLQSTINKEEATVTDINVPGDLLDELAYVSDVIVNSDQITNEVSISTSLSRDVEKSSKSFKTSPSVDLTNETEVSPSCSTNRLPPDAIESTNTDVQTIPVIDPKAIFESIKLQNERLAKKDERLMKLEDGCNKIVNTLSKTLNTGDEIMKKIDTMQNNRQNEKQEEASDETTEEIPCEEAEASTSTDIDHEARFAARDIRLKRLEEQTKSLVNKVNKTTSKGVKIHYKLEELHNIYGSEGSRAGTPSEGSEEVGDDEDDASIDKSSSSS